VISSNVSGVADALHETSDDAAETQEASERLVALSAELRDLVGKFKINAGTASSEVDAAPPPASNQQASHATA
jgi:hypothetical protein